MSLRSTLAAGIGLSAVASAADPVPVAPPVPAVPPAVIAPVPMPTVGVPLIPIPPSVVLPAVPPPVVDEDAPPTIPPAKPIELPPEPETLPAPRAVEAAPVPVKTVKPVLKPVEPVVEKPEIAIAPAPRLVPDSVGKIVQTSATHPVDAFPTMLAEAKTAYGKVRDYTCHYVRQEKLAGKLVPEQTCELRVRTNPLSVSVRVMAPKDYYGRETVYLSNRGADKVKLKEAGKWTYTTLAADDPKVLADTRHTVTDTGLLAVLERVEKAVAVEKRLNNPVQVLVGDYTYAGRECTRYEVFVDRAHAARYAHRHVIYVDKETKLPVRYEAYDQPKAGGPATGEPIEVQSFVGVKFNTGLGENTFER